jgi:carnosine N-methyltransferase
LSTKVAERIEKLSKCLEDDEIVLQKLLEPFDLVTALPNKPSGPEFKKVVAVDNSLSSSTNDDSPEEPPPTLFQMVDSKRFQTIDENAYDSAAQIVAHLVRDWTSIGTLIRKSLYDWCFVQLDTYSKISDVVLVPGAGMGRLAYNLFRKGYTVEANELSPVMAAAANAILQRQMNGTLHPFALDPMSNEVDSNRRYDSVTFPDTLLIQGNKKGSLSFTIGDFVGEYYFSQANTFGAVVTCFFIDTATNIYEYISMIAQLLKPGGVWINVGPVQWHGNAILRPSVDELKELISYHQFDIVEWKVDEKPVSYRQDESSSGNKQSDDRVFVRTTDFSAYRPLRFVAIKRKR